MPVIELDAVCMSYGSTPVLRDFSMRIEKGEFVCVTGESGSGKSTLLNIIGLLEACDKGSVKLFDKPIPSITSKEGTQLLRSQISYLFQSFALMNDKTVEENLELSLHFTRISGSERKARYREALARVGLSGMERSRIYQLSGGEQQRVALARAILKPAGLLLADEPTGSLDPCNRDRVMQILQEMHDAGKTILVVTHDPEAAAFADRIIRIEKLS